MDSEPVIKRASWLELFYDLVFVAIIAQFTYAVARQDWNIETMFITVLVGYMIFIAWWGVTVRSNLQSVETRKDRFFVQGIMVLALLLSVYLPDVFQGQPTTRFFLVYALIRAVQVGLIFRTYYLNPEHRPTTYNVTQGLSVAVLMWVATALLPQPFNFLMAGLALILEILTPFTRGRGNTVRLLNVSHIQERQGLFLLLVMGESVLVVALANTVVALTFTQPAIVIAGILHMIALWWLYFSHLEQEIEGKRARSFQVYIHAHGFLFGSIVLLAAGYQNVLKHDHLVFSDVVLLTGGTIVMILALVGVRWGVEAQGVSTYRGATIAVLTLLGLAYASITYESALLLVVGVTTVMILLALLDEKRRVYCRGKN